MRILSKTVSKACNLLLALSLLSSVLISQSGIEFKQHICNLSGHSHLDVDLIAGISALNICVDDDEPSDCCAHSSSDNSCGDCCHDVSSIEYVNIDIVKASPVQHLDAPRCLVLYYCNIFSCNLLSSVLSDDVKNIFFFIEKNAAQTHSRLCALLCTMLC